MARLSYPRAESVSPVDTHTVPCQLSAVQGGLPAPLGSLGGPAPGLGRQGLEGRAQSDLLPQHPPGFYPQWEESAGLVASLWANPGLPRPASLLE